MTCSLEKLLEQARQHFERVDLLSHFEKDSDRVATAYVALDTAEDTSTALSHYETSEAIVSDDCEKYLRLYGFLQAIFLQQDASVELHQLFVGSRPEPAGESAWTELRSLRNVTVGHPVEVKRLGEIRRTFVNRACLDADGFEYEVWNKAKADFSSERADLKALYADYEQEAAALFEAVLACLARIPGAHLG